LGVQYLASAINSSALKRIDLSENDISDEGARYLAEMLDTNMKLIQLSLSENQIGNDGVKMIADVLSRGNTALQDFNLSANTDINDESIGTLIDMIKRNQSLKKLDLRHCDFSEDGERELQAVGKSRKKFELWLSQTM
jgi:Ran GTPase-activating protein (RanGAP) involved in mRNA processing and transport